MIINEKANNIISIIKKNGGMAYIVGGCTRDYYLNRPVSDIDITTSLRPEKTKIVFESLGFSVIPTGIKHGTVTILVDKEPFEVTTFRTEGEYVDNRWPEKVEFVADVIQDLARRDFTMNAICYNEEEGFVDPFNGRTDLDKGIIRAVGDADKRFKEDALRILRGIRFASVLGFEIEENTKQALLRNKDLLNNISKERIYSELVKLLLGKNIENVLLEYKEIIFTIIPKLRECDNFAQKTRFHIYDVYTHIVKAVAASVPDKDIRLALLLHDIAKPEKHTVDEFGIDHFKGHPLLGAEYARQILNGLKVDNKTIHNVYYLILYHDDFKDISRPYVKRQLAKVGIELYRKLYEVRKGDILAHNQQTIADRIAYNNNALAIAEEVVKTGECYNLKGLAVNGEDLLNAGIKPKDIGDILDNLLNKVVDGFLPNDKDKLLKEIKNAK